MEGDTEEDLEAKRLEIEKELKKRQRLAARLRKEEEERILIAAADGKISYCSVNRILGSYLPFRPKKSKSAGLEGSK